MRAAMRIAGTARTAAVDGHRTARRTCGARQGPVADRWHGVTQAQRDARREAQKAEAKEAVRDVAGSIAAAKKALALWVDSTGADPNMAKQQLQVAGAPLLAMNVLEAATPGPPCSECGRKRFGQRWANLMLAKVLKWVQPAVEINVYIGQLCQELGVADLGELKQRVSASRSADGVETEEDAYRNFLAWANEYRRGKGLQELVEPERASVASVVE